MNRFRGLSLSGAAFCATTLSFGLSLVACGGNSSSGSDDKGSNKIESVADKEELAHCTKSHYGELVHVEETDSVYECTSEGWQVVEDERLEDLLTRSSSSRKDSDAKSSSSIAVSEGDTAKVEQVKVDSAKVTGLAQKGPYASGTVVTLYELDKDFNHTKAKFTGKIEGEKGEFAISDIVVENQYAELEANGFYMNEVTGKNTSGTKTKLTALVDLSEAKSVQANVNLFTEFEKARVIELVKQNLNVPAAKKRATQEILAAFGVKDSDVASATAISLDDTTAAGVALQAASVMVIANQTIGKSNSLIADIADDFAQNGAWTDKEIRAIVADKVQNLDSAGTLRSSASDKVLREFWTSEYGIGPCTSELEEQVKKVDNKECANHGAGFVCTDARWHKTNEIDAELGLCTAKRAGALDTIKSETSVKYYMCDAGSWVELEETVYKRTKEVGYGCVDSLQNKVVKTAKGNYFICKSGSWEESDEINYELGECSKDREGEAGKAAGSYYFCETESWKEVTKADYETGFYCTETHLNEYKNEYVCGTEGWRDATAVEVATEKVCNASNDSTFVNGYVCVKGDWREETAGEKANGHKFCVKSLYNTVSEGYACVDGAWRESKAGEDETGKVCTSSLINTLSGDYKLKCTADGWKDASAEEKATHAVCRSSNGYKVVNGYACDYDSKKTSWYWRIATEVELLESAVCNKDVAGTVKKGYTCVYENEAFGWRESTEGETATGTVCYSENSNQVKNGYACEKSVGSSYDWRTATPMEVVGGFVCNSTIANQWHGDTLSTSTTVICQENGEWRYATVGEVATKKICDSDTRDTVLNGYSCYYNSMKDSYLWRAATEMEKIANANCRSAIAGQLRGDRLSTSTTVICAKQDNGAYGWRYASEGEIKTGLMCDLSRDSTVAGEYVCINNAWSKGSDAEIETGKMCKYSYWNKYSVNKDSSAMYFCDAESSQGVAYDFHWKKVEDGDSFTQNDTRDNNVYTYKNIGKLFWSTTNLKYYAGSSYNPSSSCSGVCGCYYSQYYAACPEGTHRATNDEFNVLNRNIQYDYDGLRSTSSSWNIPSANSTPGTDKYGFAAYPCGVYYKTSATSRIQYESQAWFLSQYPVWYSSKGYSKSSSTSATQYYPVRCVYDYMGYGR